jgi:hypothetical protein
MQPKLRPSPTTTTANTMKLGILTIITFITTTLLISCYNTNTRNSTNIFTQIIHDNNNNNEQITIPSSPIIDNTKTTLTLPPPTSKFCTSTQSQFQSQFMFAARARGCAETDDWILKFIHLTYPNSNFFIDVGANKGYWSASIFELFQPQLGITALVVKDAIKTIPLDISTTGWFNECGGCNECRHVTVPFIDRRTRMCTDLASVTTSNMKIQLKSAVDDLCKRMDEQFKPITIFAFESNPELATGMKIAFETIKKSSTNKKPTSLNNRLDLLSQSTWLLKLDEFWIYENFAITSPNHPTKVDIVAGEGELGRLASEPIPPHRPDDERSAVHAKNIKPPKIISGIQAFTLDELFYDGTNNKFKLPSNKIIDILKIDAEGHDDNILQGAQKLFEHHLIRIVKFEYGALWTTTENNSQSRTLQTRMKKFDELHYSCYFEGKNALLKLNRGCWNDNLETKFWSNVWCLSEQKASPLIEIFDSYSISFFII